MPRGARAVTALKNARHEAFAKLMATGLSTQSAAYREVYGEKAGSAAACRANAARLIATDNVAQRIAALQQEAADKLATAQAEAAAHNGVDLDWLLREGKALFVAAKEAKEFHAASATLERVAKIGGLWVDRAAGDGTGVQRVYSSEPLSEKDWHSKHAPPAPQR